MKKALWIVLGLLGALGLGLVGLILACHFKPGLSDAIAEKLYKKSPKQAEEATLTEAEEAELDRLSVSDLTGEESGDLPDEESRLLPSDIPVDLPDGADAPDNSAEPASAPPAALKTLEDYGLSQEDVLNNLQEYYDDCYDQLAAYKGESTSFYNVVRDSMLGNQVLQSYDNEGYRSGFMDKFMDDYKVDTCGWSVDEEELEGGYILIKHNYTR